MYAHLYVRQGHVFIPAKATSDTGLDVTVDPVSVVELQCRERLVAEIRTALAMEPRRLSAAETAAISGLPVVVRRANCRSEREFSRGATLWTVSKGRDGQGHLVRYRRQGRGYIAQAHDERLLQLVSRDHASELARWTAEVLSATPPDAS